MSREEAIDSSPHAGKVVIVTGAASGIGQGIVLRLAGEGARPIDCDLAEPALAKVDP